MDKALIKKTAIITVTVLVVMYLASIVPAPRLPRI